MEGPDTEIAPLCESCRKASSVITLRHRQFCKSCASSFTLQKFKRQMGILNAFFETEKRATKGRLRRILLVADSSPASECLVRMLDSYYVKDNRQDKTLDSRLPHVRILDFAASGNSRFVDWRPQWMEYTQVALKTHFHARIGLTFLKGKILQTPLEHSSESSLESLLNPFSADSRIEASSILLSKIVSSCAEEGDYEVVLYPDTATKIASKVLALTSQGRGFTLPWECGSFVKMPNGVYSVRPMKDLSDTEMMVYLDIVHQNPLSAAEPETVERVTPGSIDEMMTDYIAGLEVSFPSIVATTGRTADKLDLPLIQDADSACLICSMPKRSDNVKTWLDNITVTQPMSAGQGDAENTHEQIDDNQKDVTCDICYGCYTLFRSSKGLVEWPS